MLADMNSIYTVKIGDDVYVNVMGRLYKVMSELDKGLVLMQESLDEDKLNKVDIGYGVSSAAGSAVGSSAAGSAAGAAGAAFAVSAARSLSRSFRRSSRSSCANARETLAKTAAATLTEAIFFRFVITISCSLFKACGYYTLILFTVQVLRLSSSCPWWRARGQLPRRSGGA